ncbi:MAG: hypothetical protein ABGX16_23005 [Pirellulales bacterium]
MDNEPIATTRVAVGRSRWSKLHALKTWLSIKSFQKRGKIASRWIEITCWALCLVTIGGCGTPEPDRAHISGKVSYQGKPVEFGDIVFVPSGDAAKRWKGFYCQGSISGGRYTIVEHGPVIGLNRVEIHGYRRTGKKMPNIAGVSLDKPPKVVEALIPYIPPRYNTASELTVEILPGENDGVDFEF